MVNKKSIQAYKDQDPVETIKQIRNTLKGLGIELKEKTYIPPGVKNIFSIRVTMKDLPNTGTNGKGSSLIYARASAYAEFMERLANHVLFDVGFTLNARYTYGAKKIKLSDFANSPLLGYRRNDKTYYKDFCTTYNAKSDDCYAVPFKKVNGKKILWFPTVFYCLYGSNGMASGNTYYEMSVQALSEILERYALSLILKNKAKAYVYDNEKIIKKFPQLKETYDSILKFGCHIKIYDCSINKNLPVFSLAVFDKSYRYYSVSFGAHPNAGVAIERCFTELFQGLDSFKLKCDINEKPFLQNYNLRDITHNGFGVYSKKFLNTQEESKNYAILDNRFSSNKEMYDYYLELFKKNKMPLYYRDASYLNIAAGQFICPGISFSLLPNKFQFDLLYTEDETLPYLLKFLTLKIEKQKYLFEIFDLINNLDEAVSASDLMSKYSKNDTFNFCLLMSIYSAYLKETARLNKYFNFVTSQNDYFKYIPNDVFSKIKNTLYSFDKKEITKVFAQMKFSQLLHNYNKETVYLKRVYKAEKDYYTKKSAVK